MKGKIGFLIGLVSGGIAGYLAGHFITKKKCTKRADAEIAAVRQSYSEFFANKESKEPEKKAGGEKPKKASETPATKMKSSLDGTKKTNATTVDYNKQYRKGLKKLGYIEDKEEEPDEVSPGYIYLITPEQFSESEYNVMELTYYADKVLADADDNIIRDPIKVVGHEALNSFGKYEEGAVYVRNDKEGIDYEILLDTRLYSAVCPGRLGIHHDDDDE